jgi:serine protease Do
VGVVVGDLTPDLAQAFGLPQDTKGAVVQNVLAKGPADKAGVKPGDLIVGVNGKPVGTMGDVTRAVAIAAPGEKIGLTVLRNGKKEDITIQAGTRPPEKQLARGEGEGEEGGDEGQPGDSGKSPKLGVTLAPMSPQLAQQLGVSGDQGVAVMAVAPDGPAAGAGLQKGDLILEVNRQPVSTPDQVAKLIGKMKEGQMALLRIRRADQALFVPVPVGGRQ